MGPWRAHPGNPVKVDIRSARPGGTPFVQDGVLYRPAQDCSRTYGGRIIINRVLTLTPLAFREEAFVPVDPEHAGPYPSGLHTLCEVGNTTLIDGRRFVFVPAEFRRVLRPGGRAAVSVNTVVERSYNHQINEMIARHVPNLADAVSRTFGLSDELRLKSLFVEAGFADVDMHTVKHTFVLPSFDAYYGPFERGGASTGQALATLPDEIRAAVREEARQYFGDKGGPIESETEYRIASGQCPG